MGAPFNTLPSNTGCEVGEFRQSQEKSCPPAGLVGTGGGSAVASYMVAGSQEMHFIPWFYEEIGR